MPLELKLRGHPERPLYKPLEHRQLGHELLKGGGNCKEQCQELVLNRSSLDRGPDDVTQSSCP